MGRHSLPDPEDSDPDAVPKASEESFAESPYPEDEVDHGRHSGDQMDFGSSETVPEPRADTSFDDDEVWSDDYHDSDDIYYADEGQPFASWEPQPGGDESRAGGDMASGSADEYPDFPPRQPSTSALDPSMPPPPLYTAGHRGIGEWRGGHRSSGRRRGVSIGVIVALIAIVAVVGVWILWKFFLGDALSHRSHNAAARCVGGKETVAVIADPTIADQVRELAESYNSTAGPVGDRCMSVSVKPAASEPVLAGFGGKWPSDLGDQPALWIPGSSVSAARLAEASSQKIVTDSRSLVTSPVLLAIRPEFQQALSSQNWAALPGLQTNPNSLAGLNLPTWGSLKLALPSSGNGDASLLAGEAVAAASVTAGAPPTQGTGAARTLIGAQPKLADTSLGEALNALLNSDAAAAPVHAVITTEQQLFQRGQSLSDAKSKLGSWLPPGPVAVADYPTVLLSGSWLSREQTEAASAFARFMQKPEQLAKLAKAGFRVADVKPPSSPVTSFPALPPALSVGDEAMRATLANALSSPSAGVAATILLDQSLPTDDGGKTRLANVVAALNGRVKAMPPTSVVGLWTFDGHEGRSEVATGPLADQVNGQPRSAALVAALDKQYSSGGGAVSFTTLRNLYQDMLANYRAGQTNSILLITAGPHTDQTLDGPGLQDFIRRAVDQARPVAVNVIDFGADPDRATWEAVAQLSGGSYRNLGTSASPDLAAAVNTFLS